MKSFIVLGLAAAAMAQTPEGCSSSSPNSFQISTVNISSSATKRDLGDIQRRQLAGALTMQLTDGVLRDQAGRQGYIASNYQFQFDAPVQAGARETSGFSLCSNGSLALSGTTVWYQCLSGTFYNLYSQAIREQDCIAIHIQAVNQGAGVSQITDGQPQATSPGVVSQITDGQPQATSPGAVVSQISDGQPQATSPGPVVSQISDGQPQATAPGPVVSQISDGQPQATAPAGPVVSQISDGQPQASAPAGPVVSQISDGQPQAPAPTAGPVVSQISDGQPQAPAPTGNVTTPPLTEFTGAAVANGATFGAFAAGLMGLFALL